METNAWKSFYPGRSGTRAADLWGRDDQAPSVAVTGGKIQGMLLKSGGAVFKGVPFAAHPVGELRVERTRPGKRVDRRSRCDSVRSEVHADRQENVGETACT